MEPLKNAYNKKYITKLASKFSNVYPSFNNNQFVKDIFSKEWPAMELKARMRHITLMLGKHLPEDYPTALPIILKAAPSFGSYEAMFFPDFVEIFGFNPKHEKISLDALIVLTQYSSSEFAIRPFIKRDPQKIMKVMLKWSQHKNEHVRRLASEGCRSRLPWGMRLHCFVDDPTLILPILENLKHDSSEYVRRSVANNLNDISKDHPDVTLRIAKSWLGKSEETDKLVKHGLRTLLKKGDSKALRLFGYKESDIKIIDFKCDTTIKVGDRLHFQFSVKLKKSSKLRIEYILHYLLKNGKYAHRVFKMREGTFEAGGHQIEKAHHFKPISVRSYYLGEQKLSIQINGVAHKPISFQLT